MPIYRAYPLTSHSGRAADPLERDYEEDIDARAWARVMMADNSALAGVKVWCGERLVFELSRLPKPGTPH